MLTEFNVEAWFKFEVEFNIGSELRHELAHTCDVRLFDACHISQKVISTYLSFIL